MSDNTTGKLLANGVADAVGFVWLGVDIFAPSYGTGSLIGIALVGLGGGLGLHAARRWQTRRQDKASAKE